MIRVSYMQPAIGRLLSQYRESLSIPRERKLLRNVERAIIQLEMQKSGSGSVSRDLEADGEPVTIGIKLPGEDLDEIELRSIFADIVAGDAGTALSEDELDSIFRWLGRWAELSENTEDALFNAVESLLDICRRDDDQDHDLVEVMAAREDLWHGHDQFRVRRLAMLFAWVTAAQQKIHQPDQPLVFLVHQALGIHADEPDTRYRRLMTRNDRICLEDYRTPFVIAEAYRDAPDSRARAYRLGAQTPAGAVQWVRRNELALTDQELEFCRQYARSVNSWTDEEQWPVWLRE